MKIEPKVRYKIMVLTLLDSTANVGNENLATQYGYKEVVH